MAIEKVKNLGLYVSLISDIEKSIIFSTSQDEIILTDTKEDTRLKKGLEVVRSGCQALLMVLKDLYQEEDDESTLYLRMPRIKDLEDLGKKSKLLHTAISQSILDPSIKGNIKVRSYDIGSLWIVITVGSVLAVKLMGGIVWSAAVIRRRKMEFKKFEKHVKSLVIRNESQEDLKDAQKRQLESVLEAEAENLAKQYFKGHDAEKTERIKYSIKLICELMDKGVEIHPALKAPGEIGKLFPDYANLGLIESRIPALGAGA
jgi:hypothetical protein